MMSLNELPKSDLGPLQFKKFYLTHKNSANESRKNEIFENLQGLYWDWIPSDPMWLQNTFGKNSYHPLKNESLDYIKQATNGDLNMQNYINRTKNNTLEGMWIATEKSGRSVWFLKQKNLAAGGSYILSKYGAWSLGIDQHPSILIYYDAINKRNL